ncbi:hypothetical protein [Dictyobacter vulcani]|nr:hypothetical protein [Dictyobacter vulcani]
MIALPAPKQLKKASAWQQQRVTIDEVVSDCEDLKPLLVEE